VLIRQVVLPNLHYSYADLLEICRGADLLLTHALAFAVPLVAEQLHIPWMTMALQPLAFFSAYDPPYIPWASWVYALRNLGSWPNRALRALVRAGARDWDVPVRRLRKELGLPAQRGNALIEGMRSRWGTLALFSREFAREQPDWPRPSWATGFAFFDAGPPVSPELERFLDDGEPPVVFTLGDSTSQSPGNFFEQSALAAQRLGCRALFLTGCRLPSSLPPLSRDRLFVAAYAPFSRVFPWASAVVQPGGIGTIACALTAHRPMLSVPWAFDQADNSRRACRLGVSRLLPRSGYNRENVFRELSVLLSDPGYARKAQTIGSRIAAEDGVCAACDRIETVLSAGADLNLSGIGRNGLRREPTDGEQTYLEFGGSYAKLFSESKGIYEAAFSWLRHDN
jgi:UDP:flavonoid glycosyltransferase YjiC (YdhE family)